MNTKVNKISFAGTNIYIGIDVHLKSWKVTIMVDNITYKSFSMDPDVQILVKHLEQNFPEGNYYSAYEAGFSGYQLHRELVSYGINNIVVNPADIPTTDKENRQKEDKRDSRKIARSLRNEELLGIYIPDSKIEELRGLVRYRKRLVEDISRQKTRIKSYLYYHGIKIPYEHKLGAQHWSARFTNWLNNIEMSTAYGSEVISHSVKTVSFLRKQLLDVNKLLKDIAQQEPYVNQISLLRSVPGVGLVVAFTLLTEIVDINRFKNLDRLCSFVGLIPTTNSSGEKEKTGNITYRSNQSLRGVLFESAWVAIRYDPVLASTYHKLCKRMNGNKAIVKVTKKLLSRIRFVLKNQQEYKVLMN